MNAYESVDIVGFFKDVDVWSGHVFIVHGGAVIVPNQHFTAFASFSADPSLADGCYELKNDKINSLDEVVARELMEILQGENTSLGFALLPFLEGYHAAAGSYQPPLLEMRNAGGVGKITKTVATALEKEGLFLAIFSKTNTDHHVLYGSVAPDIDGLLEILGGVHNNISVSCVSHVDMYGVMKHLGKAKIRYGTYRNASMFSGEFPYPLFILASVDRKLWSVRNNP